MRTALADFGYLEGRNLAIEFRYGDDVIERVPGLAVELVRLPVDLIVAQGGNECCGHPMAMRHRRDEALPTRRPSIKPHHIRLCSSFINEDKINGERESKISLRWNPSAIPSTIKML